MPSFENQTPEQQAASRNQYQQSSGNWIEESMPNWALNNQINPETGLLEGDFPVVPHGYGREYQARADHAAEMRRQKFMQGGINFAMGALGNLQSYRPGGSAALESGQYNALSQMMFNRAQMTRAPDLLSDLRRHTQARIESRNRRAQERNNYVRIGTTLVQAAASYFGGGGGMAAAQAIGAVAPLAVDLASGETYNGYSYSGGQAGVYNDYQARLGQNRGQGEGTQFPSGPAFPGGGGAQNSQSAPIGSSGRGAGSDIPSDNIVDYSGSQQGGSAAAGSAAAGATLEQESVAAPVPDNAAAAAKPGSQQAAGALGAGSAAMSGFGVDGDFTNRSMAASASMMASTAPIESVGERIGMMEYAAELYESDPFHSTYGAAVNALYTSVIESISGDIA